MSLTNRYLTSVKNVPGIMDAIVRGTAPAKFTQQHLKDIGFPSSNDRAIIGVLKDLGFLTDDGTPTPRYHAYRSRTDSRRIMAEAIREAYGDLFTINAQPTDQDRPAIQGKFKSAHNATDRVAQEQAKTFFALLNLADLDGGAPLGSSDSPEQGVVGAGNTGEDDGESETPDPPRHRVELGYTIQVHLPATTDINVYNAVFKSLKDHLLA